VELAAASLGLKLATANASTEAEIERAFAMLSQRRVAAILFSADGYFYNQIPQLVSLADRHAVPAMHFSREYVAAGGLMSYGTSLAEAYRLAGTYVGRILKGEKPADLPVHQSTKVELAINFKTAKALGLSFPITLLGRVDEVIE
jgi:putative tryptophan/tyrosine transport system substrate-binding protein